MENLPLLTRYNLLVGARKEKTKELERLRKEWGDTPTKRQEKVLKERENKISEFNETILEIEEFMRIHHIQPKE